MQITKTGSTFSVIEQVTSEYQEASLLQQIQWLNDQIAQIEAQRDKLQAILDTPETAS